MKYLTVAEAAGLLQVHEKTVRAWCRDGKIKATRRHPTARAWCIDRAQFVDLIDEDKGEWDGTQRDQSAQ